MSSHIDMLKDKIKNLSEEYFGELSKVRRHLHSIPELSFSEYNTSRFISQKLEEYGIKHFNIAKTGLIGVINGNKGKGKVVALRAELDALPIIEENDVEYKSENTGVMHACGHDVHLACLLGTAKILTKLKDDFAGSVKLIFQPGEEKLPGGALQMIKEGVLKAPSPTVIYAQHVDPDLQAGTVGFASGEYMASSDEIYLLIKGIGGHGGMPYKLIDPVLITSHLIVALQQIISRNAKSTIPTVLSFGKVIADGATNIIPNEVYIEGSFRTFDENWRIEAHKKIKQVCVNLVKSMGGVCEIEIRKGYPSLNNDAKITAKAKEIAIDYLGVNNVVELEKRMTAEDFAYFSQQVPSCFYRLGTGNISKGIKGSLHSSTFDIDEDALKTGTGLMTYLTLNEQ